MACLCVRPVGAFLVRRDNLLEGGVFQQLSKTKTEVKGQVEKRLAALRDKMEGATF